jgi:glyoxylase-like metal-dependent hydrolase (beta-lactamase superfamily II)
MRGVSKVANRPNSLVDPELPSVDTDIVVESDLDLGECCGIDGTAILTPGHTLGSLSVYLQSGEIVIGDTFLRLGGFGFMPLFEDRSLIRKSLGKILDLKPHTIYMSHGGACRVEVAQRLYARQFKEDSERDGDRPVVGRA